MNDKYYVKIYKLMYQDGYPLIEKYVNNVSYNHDNGIIEEIHTTYDELSKMLFCLEEAERIKLKLLEKYDKDRYFIEIKT